MLALATYQISTLLLLSLLATAAMIDLRCHRVPNLLSIGGLLLCLGLNIWFLGFGTQGLLSALGGALLALVIFLPFYSAGGMGAGDVKLMVMAAAFLDPRYALLAAGLSLATGSLMGLGILLMRRGFGCMARRYVSTFQCLAVTGRWSYVPPEAHEPAAARFPYALAIALGTLAALWWSGTLSDFIYLSRAFLLWIIN
ncbi:MAG TPA: prepilin peptidase [Gammaproteobacteria bacterium]|nr:prepilin peptidase [Gammaproteobacteria bacterium]